MAVKQIPIREIVDNPFNARTDFDADAIRSLADEIKAEGFWATSLQGRRTKNGKVELVYGHRRLRALKLLKADTVAIEIVDLTDAQMALRSLEENIQREGLSDLEKADAVKQAVQIERAALEAAGKNPVHAAPHVAARLGFRKEWVNQLCDISNTIVFKNRELVAKKYLSAKTAWLAKDWGGDVYVKTLAAQGRLAEEEKQLPADERTVTKPSENTIFAMKKAVQLAPESIRPRLQELIWTGEVTSAKEAEQKGRRLAAERTKRNKLPPKDLDAVLVGWTHQLEDWTAEVKTVLPYIDYLDTVPALATPFRAALKVFIATAQPLLDEGDDEQPRPVGRGQSSGAKQRKRLSS